MISLKGAHRAGVLGAAGPGRLQSARHILKLLRTLALGSSICGSSCVPYHMVQWCWPKPRGPGSPLDPKTVFWGPATCPGGAPYCRLHPICSTCLSFSLSFSVSTLLLRPCPEAVLCGVLLSPLCSGCHTVPRGVFHGVGATSYASLPKMEKTHPLSQKIVPHE